MGWGREWISLWALNHFFHCLEEGLLFGAVLDGLHGFVDLGLELFHACSDLRHLFFLVGGVILDCAQLLHLAV